MTVFVTRDGTDRREYSIAGFKAGVAAGAIMLSDHYWHEGMADWKPVHESQTVLEQRRRTRRQTWQALAIAAGVIAVITIFALTGGGSSPSEPTLAQREQIEAKAQAREHKVAEAIANSKVIIGMTAAQCRSAWGEPESVNSTITPYGRHEQWVYASGNYLYLENGILRSVQTSR